MQNKRADYMSRPFLSPSGKKSQNGRMKLLEDEEPAKQGKPPPPLPQPGKQRTLAEQSAQPPDDAAGDTQQTTKDEHSVQVDRLELTQSKDGCDDRDGKDEPCRDVPRGLELEHFCQVDFDAPGLHGRTGGVRLPDIRSGLTAHINSTSPMMLRIAPKTSQNSAKFFSWASSKHE